MKLYLFNLINKVYNFWKFKIFENKSIQTELHLICDNKLIQTDIIYIPLLCDKSTQTDMQLINFNEDHEWDNLTWYNYNNII